MKGAELPSKGQRKENTPRSLNMKKSIKNKERLFRMNKEIFISKWQRQYLTDGYLSIYLSLICIDILL